MNESLIQKQQEQSLAHFIINEKGRDEYHKLRRNYGSLREFLHKKGLNNQAFTGVFDENKQSGKRKNARADIPSSNHLCEARGVTPNVIGSIIPNGSHEGKLVGPFIYQINYNEKPMVPRSFGLMIEREDGHYFTYGIMDLVKAILMFYGDRPLTTSGKNILDFLKYEDFDFSSIDFKQDRYCLEVGLEGYFGGNAGEFTVDSASKRDVTQHEVSIKQPLMVINGNYLFPDNAKYETTTKLTKKKLDERPEFRKNSEPDKYAVMALIALKWGVAYTNSLGHEIRIEVPENRPVNDLYYKKINDQLKSVLTLYEPLESPFLPNIQLNEKFLADDDKWVNELFCEVIGEAVYLYYEKVWTARQVDNQIMSKYGLDILTPKLKWDMILNQKEMKERFKKTAEISGSVIRGEIRTEGSVIPYKAPVYEVEPQMIAKNIDSPFYVSSIQCYNGSVPVEAEMTFGIPARDYKLHQCWTPNNGNSYQFFKQGNVYTTCFGGFYKKGYKPKFLHELNVPNFNGVGVWNPDFYNNPEEYAEFFKKQREKLSS